MRMRRSVAGDHQSGLISLKYAESSNRNIKQTSQLDRSRGICGVLITDCNWGVRPVFDVVSMRITNTFDTQQGVHLRLGNLNWAIPRLIRDLTSCRIISTSVVNAPSALTCRGETCKPKSPELL